MQYPKPGPGLVSEYQVSGLPHITSGSGSGIVKIEFPYVTQWIQIKNNGTTKINYSFTANGITGGNRGELNGTNNFIINLPVKVKDIWVRGNFIVSRWEVTAGLTMIERDMFPTLSESFAPGVVPPFSSSSGFGYSGLG